MPTKTITSTIGNDMTSPMIIRRPWSRVEILLSPEAPVSEVIEAVVSVVGVQNRFEFATYAVDDRPMSEIKMEFLFDQEDIDLRTVTHALSRWSQSYTVHTITRWTLMNLQN